MVVESVETFQFCMCSLEHSLHCCFVGCCCEAVFFWIGFSGHQQGTLVAHVFSCSFKSMSNTAPSIPTRLLKNKSSQPVSSIPSVHPRPALIWLSNQIRFGSHQTRKRPSGHSWCVLVTPSVAAHLSWYPRLALICRRNRRFVYRLRTRLG